MLDAIITLRYATISPCSGKMFQLAVSLPRSARKRFQAMLDEMDVKILRILQQDCTRSVADIGKEVGLSTTPCWRRIQKLEEAGVIRRRVAVLDPTLVNAGV